MRNFLTRTAFSFLAVLGLTHCGDDVISGIDGGDLTICQIRMMDAGPAPRCTADEDCCDRESCNTSTGICVPLDECTVDADCPADNQLCVDEDDDGFFECIFDRCTDESDCSDLECDNDEIPTCSAGGCICGQPCQGGCAEGQGCCVPQDQCYDLPPECEGLTCPAGEFVSVTTAGSWDTGMCEFTGEVCACELLPPLPFGDIGLYSALARGGSGRVVSGYNITYGDLMYGEVQPDLSIDWSFVDGVPSTTVAITGRIDGPRGGNSDPGPDVGLYTDIWVDPDDNVHIGYQNRNPGTLEYARYNGTSWAFHTVASSPVSGMYTSLTPSSENRPVLAWLTHREDTPNSPGARQSVLRVAVASTRTPTVSADWSIVDVVTTDLSSFDCATRCRIGEECRSSDGLCFEPQPGLCSTPCQGNRECYEGTCEPTEDLPNFRQLPTARGLWPSAVSLSDGTVLVAFYDSIDTAVKIAELAGPNPETGAITITTIDGQAEDAGQFPSLFVTGNDEVHLAYMNETQRSLEYRQLDASLNPTVIERVATGIDSGVVPGGSLLGADPALVVDAQGTVRIAFQDSTEGLLRYARRTGANTWSIETLRGGEAMDEGSFGFYNDQVLDAAGANPSVSTYRYFLSALPDPDNGLEILEPAN